MASPRAFKHEHLVLGEGGLKNRCGAIAINCSTKGISESIPHSFDFAELGFLWISSIYPVVNFLHQACLHKNTWCCDTSDVMRHRQSECLVAWLGLAVPACVAHWRQVPYDATVSNGSILPGTWVDLQDLEPTCSPWDSCQDSKNQDEPNQTL